MRYKQFLKNIKRQFSYVGAPERLFRVGKNFQKYRVLAANIKDREVHLDCIEYWVVNEYPNEDIIGVQSEQIRREELISEVSPKRGK